MSLTLKIQKVKIKRLKILWIMSYMPNFMKIGPIHKPIVVVFVVSSLLHVIPVPSTHTIL
jgi:hypothetical protein